MSPSVLYLLPNLLSEESLASDWFPQLCFEVVPRLDGLICESEKGARRYLKLFTFPEGKSFRDVPLLVLSEHTKGEELGKMISQIKGGTWGLISDAGLPLLADPGSVLVALARRAGIRVVALPGPSSVILSLMLSGLPSQAFAFHGYLPREGGELIERLKVLEERSRKEGSTQLCIEAPYRNLKLFEAMVQTLKGETALSVASDLTGPKEFVITQTVKRWKGAPPPPIQKIPTIFLFYLTNPPICN